MESNCPSVRRRNNFHNNFVHVPTRRKKNSLSHKTGKQPVAEKWIGLLAVIRRTAHRWRTGHDSPETATTHTYAKTGSVWYSPAHGHIRYKDRIHFYTSKTIILLPNYKLSHHSAQRSEISDG